MELDTTKLTTSEAFEYVQGWRAFESKKPATANPHVGGSMNWTAWYQGWKDAREYKKTTGPK